MNVFVPENAAVQIYWDAETDTYLAKTNISPTLKVDITVLPKNGQPDMALHQGLPFLVEVS